MYKLGELAELLGLTLEGDPQQQIVGLATLAKAGSQQLSFLDNSKYQQYLTETKAAAVIVRPDLASQCPVSCLLSEQPYLSYARASRLFERKPKAEKGIHPSTVVDESAQVSSSASIGPLCYIGANTYIKEGVVVGAGTVIGDHCRIDRQTVLQGNVTLYQDVKVGASCIIHSGAVLGSDGFGFAAGDNGWEKISQLGGVTIGNNVEIGAGTTVDRGALDDTVIEDGVIIDNLVQIAHNVHIGKNTAIAGCTGVAGSTNIGARCTIGGAVGITGHLNITDDVHITAMSLVTRSITEAGSYSSGTVVADTRQWRKNAVRFGQLETLHRRVTQLENTNSQTD